MDKAVDAETNLLSYMIERFQDRAAKAKIILDSKHDIYVLKEINDKLVQYEKAVKNPQKLVDNIDTTGIDYRENIYDLEKRKKKDY